MDEHSWLSLAELRSYARAQGFVVSERQLERWRKADLLPRPRRVSLGRGRGFRSEYPAHAREQLLAICRLSRKGGRLNLDLLCVIMWRQGVPIPSPAIKRAIERLAFRPFRLLPRHGKEPDQIAQDAAALAMEDLPRSRLGRTIRRRTRSDAGTQRLFAGIIQATLGGTPVFARDETKTVAEGPPIGDLLAEAMGLTTARTRGIGAAGPWLTGDPAADFARFEREGLWSFERLLEALRSAAPDALERARSDADTLLTGLTSMSQLLHITGAPEIFGWVFRDFDPADPAAFGWMVVALLALREVIDDAAIAAITSTLAELQGVLSVVQGLLAAAPELAPFFNPETGQQAFTEQDPTARAQITNRVQALITLHPDWEARLAEAGSEANETPRGSEQTQ